ncbi:DUF7859 family protein [Halalkalirubrum salinum]|nr:hypothetical protein [Halalkalirubrum salinum]
MVLDRIDPIFVGILLVLVVFFFFGYLLVRRTVLGLREGYRDGQK